MGPMRDPFVASESLLPAPASTEQAPNGRSVARWTTRRRAHRPARCIEGCKSNRRRRAATRCKDLRVSSTAGSLPPTVAATRLRLLSGRLIRPGVPGSNSLRH